MSMTSSTESFTDSRKQTTSLPIYMVLTKMLQFSFLFFLKNLMRKFKHKKLWWIANEMHNVYVIEQPLQTWWSISVVKELIEDSSDREEIKEEIIRASNGMYIGDKDKVKYWYVNSYGNTDNSYTDATKWICRQTKEQAERYARKLQAEKNIRKRQAEHDNGWVPDWSDPNKMKCFLYYSHEDEEVHWSFNYISQSNNIYFSKEYPKLLKELKEDLIIYCTY